MNAVVVATLVVAWMGLFLYTIYRAVEDESKVWIGAAALVLIAGLAACLYAAQKEEEQGPCLREETGYVMSGKVMVPYTYCVERGTWADR